MNEIKFRIYDSYAKKMISFENLMKFNLLNLIFVAVQHLKVMQYTGLKGKNGVEIYEGDITELIVSGNDRRRFVVSIEKVVREVVNHPDFAGPSSKVEIMGVVFKWEGYELFPMLDENGRSDVSRMRVIGNIHDNPELIEGS